MADELFYPGADFPTLNDLELTCEDDEANQTMGLKNLELGKQGSKDGTIGTYEESDEENLGELIFEEYSNIEQANLLETQHKMQGKKHLFRGKARIGSKSVKVTVFRG